MEHCEFCNVDHDDPELHDDCRDKEQRRLVRNFTKSELANRLLTLKGIDAKFTALHTENAALKEKHTKALDERDQNRKERNATHNELTAVREDFERDEALLSALRITLDDAEVPIGFADGKSKEERAYTVVERVLLLAEERDEFTMAAKHVVDVRSILDKASVPAEGNPAQRVKWLAHDRGERMIAATEASVASYAKLAKAEKLVADQHEVFGNMRRERDEAQATLNVIDGVLYQADVADGEDQRKHTTTAKRASLLVEDRDHLATRVWALKQETEVNGNSIANLNDKLKTVRAELKGARDYQTELEVDQTSRACHEIRLVLKDLGSGGMHLDELGLLKLKAMVALVFREQDAKLCDARKRLTELDEIDLNRRTEPVRKQLAEMAQCFAEMIEGANPEDELDPELDPLREMCYAVLGDNLPDSWKPGSRSKRDFVKACGLLHGEPKTFGATFNEQTNGVTIPLEFFEELAAGAAKSRK